MSGIVIRPAQTTEHILAAQLLFRAYGDHLAQGPGAICIDNFDAEIATLPAPYLAILLATVDGDPAGCVALKALHIPHQPACEMKRLFVPNTHRGLGLGRHLVLAAIEHARHAGYAAMYLDTVPAAMPQANQLYASLGFVPCERYNTNSVPNVVFFRRDL